MRPSRCDADTTFGVVRVGPVRFVAAGQLAYLAGMAVCIAIRPRYLVSSDEGGISNFGVHAVTAMPFSFAFVLAAGCLLAAGATALPRTAVERWLVAGLWALSGLLVVVLASTYGYQHGPVAHGLHVYVSIAATAFESALAVFCVVAVRHELADGAALVAQLAGLVLAALAFSGTLHVLLVGQLLGSAGFAVLAVRAARCLEPGQHHAIEALRGS